MSQDHANASATRTALAVICGAGSLPFALAEAAKARNRRVVLFALRGSADAKRVANYPHHWLWIGQFGRFMKLAAAEGCREVAFIGSVTRPSILSMRPDFLAVRHLPQMIRMLRGRDDDLEGA